MAPDLLTVSAVVDLCRSVSECFPCVCIERCVSFWTLLGGSGGAAVGGLGAASSSGRMPPLALGNPPDLPFQGRGGWEQVTQPIRTPGRGENPNWEDEAGNQYYRAPDGSVWKHANPGGSSGASQKGPEAVWSVEGYDRSGNKVVWR